MGGSKDLGPTAMKLNLMRPPSANKKNKLTSNTSMSTMQMLAMNVDKASVRDVRLAYV